MKKFFGVLIAVLLVLATVSACAETFTFSLVGDCTVGAQYKYQKYKNGFIKKVDANGWEYPFSLAADLFAADDLTIANCEGVFTTRKLKKGAKEMSLCAPPEYAEIFKLGNVDVCNLANNHGRDFGWDGFYDTQAAMDAQGIKHFGYDYTLTMEVKGVKIGFVGYCYPIDKSKMRSYKEKIAELRADGCTFIIASAHWGKEESLNINLQQRSGAPALIDMGADMVYGHGSHTLQPIQIYKGKVIFYSLSNFTFGANANPKDADTAVVQLTYDINEDGTMTARELLAIPYKMHNKGDFRPYPIEDAEAWTKCMKKLVFYKDKDPDSCLPDTFLETGYADLRDIVAQQLAELETAAE
ncbi:MAG: CapA family protein [Clostridia bacterium]|nr:CapA family protein [Clostridia bacterium]